MAPDEQSIAVRLAAIMGAAQVTQRPDYGTTVHVGRRRGDGFQLEIEVGRAVNVAPEWVFFHLECTSDRPDPVPTFEEAVAAGHAPPWLPEGLRRALGGRRIAGFGGYATSLADTWQVEIESPDPSLQAALASFLREVGWSRPPYASDPESEVTSGAIGSEGYQLVYPRAPRADWILSLDRMRPSS